MRVQGFTPERPGSTHVFLRITRNYATDREVVAEHLQSMFTEWAQRDAAVLELTQRTIDDDPPSRRYINLKADPAALRARRVAQAMVEEETARGSSRAPRAR